MKIKLVLLLIAAALCIQASMDEADLAEIGGEDESASLGRRGGQILTTSGSFVLSANRAGNDEEELGEEDEEATACEGPTKCGSKGFCLGTEAGTIHCYGKSTGCKWGSKDCTKDSDCAKYTSLSPKHSLARSCPSSGWPADACTCGPPDTWPGAFNSTHSAAMPRSQTLPQQPKFWKNSAHKSGPLMQLTVVPPSGFDRCKTRAATDTTEAGACSAEPLDPQLCACTSCNDGFAYVAHGAIKRGRTAFTKSYQPMSGTCITYSHHPHYYCKNNAAANATERLLQCTKVVTLDHSVHLSQADIDNLDTPQQAAMTNLLAREGEGTRWVINRCNLWKQTYCHGSKCQSRKNIKCVGVCRLTSRTWLSNGARGTAGCDSSLCTNKTCETQAIVD